MQFIQSLNASRLMNLVFALVAIFGLTFVAACDEPTAGEKVENAADEMGDGIEEAAEEFDGDRTMGEEMGDSIEDAGEELQERAN